MNKLAKAGVMHFGIDCDMYVAAKSLFETAEEFLSRAVDEDAGDEFAKSREEAMTLLRPFVKEGYVVYRCTPHPSDADLEEWWEFTKSSGRGHSPAWYVDMEEVRTQTNSGHTAKGE